MVALRGSLETFSRLQSARSDHRGSSGVRTGVSAGVVIRVGD